MKSALMLGALQDLGITASFSRPRVSNDNPYAESLFRTLKTRHDYPAPGFDCEEQARSCVAAAVSWINPQHRHKNLNYVTPMQRRRGEDRLLLSRRTALTAAACQARPECWHGRSPMDWSLPERVRLGYGEEPELMPPPALHHVPAEDFLPLKTM